LANAAGVGVSEVLAARTEDDLILNGNDGFSERASLSFRHTQQMIGQPSSALGSYTRQFIKFLDQPRNRLGSGSESGIQLNPFINDNVFT